MRSHFLAILAMSSLWACGGPKKVSHSPDETDVLYEEMDSDSQDDKITGGSNSQVTVPLIMRAKLTCAKGQVCPKNVVSLTVAKANDPDNFSTCSGFLISPDTVATNIHCIDKIAKENCSDNVVLDFMDGSKRRCKEIYYNDADYIDERKTFNGDFAIIELDSPVAAELVEMSISHRGFNDEETVKVVKVNTSAVDRLVRRVFVAECQVLENSPEAAYYSDVTKFFVPLFHCSSKIIEGNSGSMIVNSDGQIGGIANASNVDFQSSVKKLIDSLFNGTAASTDSENDNSVKYGRGVNFLCLELDVNFRKITWSNEAICERVPEKVLELGYNQVIVPITKQLQRKITAVLDQKVIKDVLPFVVYELESSGDHYNFQPKCFNYKNFEGDEADLPKTIPVASFSVKKEIDSHFRPVFEIQNSKLEQRDYTLASMKRSITFGFDDYLIHREYSNHAISLLDCSDKSIEEWEDSFK